MAYDKGNGRSAVVALGGNALGDTPEEQLELVKSTAENITNMVSEGINVVVSHGNGPQVGMINAAFEAASRDPENKVPFVPLPECGAMSQGYIGYHLTQALLGEIRLRGLNRSVANIVTQTVVDENDPAFDDPTKPVGAFMDKEEAEEYAKEIGCAIKEDAGRGWRRVVASPQPVRIVEFDAICELLDAGFVVVAGGGGGIPVIERGSAYEGVPAVIDKDRSSAKLAADLGVDTLVILTAVEKVFVNFGKPDQRAIDTMTVEEAERYIEEGQFAPGSMLPKVQACIEFVRAHPEGQALITSLECAAAGLRGETGTVITAG